MDSNTKPTANAMDSSISSLTASFRKLEVDTCTGDGPINRLPNELMQQIMAKLRLDRDIRKLFPLRLVSTRWRALIEDYCRLKKSLFIHFHPNAVPSDFTSYFKNILFGFANFNNFSCLFLSTEATPECLSSLLNMFPNIEQLSIYCGYYAGYERTLDNSLEVYIKSLDSLKLLDLNGSSLTQLYPALSKLEHFSYNCSGHKDDLLQLIPHLGPNCVRINFGHSVPFLYDQVRQWHHNNPACFANLTHLRIRICERTPKKCARVVHLLSKNAILVQHLDISTSHEKLRLKRHLLQDLAKLTNLTYLSLPYIKITFSKLEQLALQHRLTSLTSVLTFELCIHIDEDFNYFTYGDKFTRVLSAIFPNLLELDLTFEVAYSAKSKALAVQRQIEQHLNRFSHLRKHKMEVI